MHNIPKNIHRNCIRNAAYITYVSLNRSTPYNIIAYRVKYFFSDVDIHVLLSLFKIISIFVRSACDTP